MSSSSTAQVILPPLISSRWRVKSRDQSLLDSHVTYQLKKKKKNPYGWGSANFNRNYSNDILKI